MAAPVLISSPASASTLEEQSTHDRAKPSAKAAVTATVKRLIRFTNNGKLAKARRIATAEIVDVLKDGESSLQGCRRSTYEGDDFNYGGPLPWGCSVYTEVKSGAIGGYGIGFKKVNGKWKARDLTSLAT
jgi:hypothetical protein